MLFDESPKLFDELVSPLFMVQVLLKQQNYIIQTFHIFYSTHISEITNFYWLSQIHFQFGQYLLVKITEMLVKYPKFRLFQPIKYWSHKWIWDNQSVFCQYICHMSWQLSQYGINMSLIKTLNPPICASHQTTSTARYHVHYIIHHTDPPCCFWLKKAYQNSLI